MPLTDFIETRTKFMTYVLYFRSITNHVFPIEITLYNIKHEKQNDDAVCT